MLLTHSQRLAEIYPDFPEFAKLSVKIEWAMRKRKKLNGGRCRKTGGKPCDSAHLLPRRFPHRDYCAYDPAWITTLHRFWHSWPGNPECYDKQITVRDKWLWLLDHGLDREAAMLEPLVMKGW